MLIVGVYLLLYLLRLTIRCNHKYTLNIDFTNRDSNAGTDISQEDIIYEDGGTTNITHYNE